MKESTITLFDKEVNCCGCSACMNVCPKNAIHMEENKYGFVFPKIDENLCIKCGACKKVCSYQKENNGVIPSNTYIFVNKNKQQIMKSASGGAFSAIATKVLEEDGVVFGAAYVKEDGKLTVKHISVTDIAELPRLQGSKYVQSSIGFAYKEAKQYLLQGRKVLFSGTPCQIDALKGFLKKDYDNLILVDVICHGVPSQKMFNQYVDLLEEKNKMDIDDFSFRNKKKGWDIFYLNISNSYKNKDIFWELSSYYKLFVKGYTYRENCYYCKYAEQKRISDITIGDYWGIRKQHPELFKDDNWFEYGYEGISCVMVNNEKGQSVVDSIGDRVELLPTTYEKVSVDNGQLRHPTPCPKEREAVLDLYNEKGFGAVDKAFFDHEGKNLQRVKVKSLIPTGFKKKVKKLKRKLH